MHRARGSLGRLLLHAVAAAALVAVALGDGLPLDGDPLQLRYTGPNPCSVDGQLLDTVQVPDPQSCNQYFVCCQGQAVHYACRVPSSPMPYMVYSDANATNSYYSPATGECTRTQGQLSTQTMVCPATGVAPVTTDWADQVCTAIAGYKGAQDPAAAAPAAGTSTPAAGAARATPLGRRVGRSPAPAPAAAGGNGTRDAAAAAGKPQYQRVSPTHPYDALDFNLKLQPLQGGPDVTGAWQLIVGPDGHSSTGTIAMHAALIPGTEKVVVWSRRLPQGVAYQAGMSPNGRGEVSSVFDTATGTYVATPMDFAPFCTGQSHTSDGTIIATGGDADVGGYLKDGLRAIRLWRKDAKAWEIAPVQLAEPHWYPTQLPLGDGVRTLIVGGYANGETGTPTPSIEIFDYKANTVTTLSRVPELVALGGLNLYPLVIQLPWTDAALPAGSYPLFLFAGSAGQVMFASPDNQVNALRDLPPWPTPGASSAMSAAGGHTLLTLDPDTGYAAEVAMFGGTTFTGGACACDVPANDRAYRIKLDKDTVLNNAMAWEVEQMPGPRVMVDATLLPNGKVILVNGAKSGNSNNGGPGGGGQARDMEGHAWLYDPKAPAGGRFSVLAASAIKRFYHSTAMLLPSGDLLVMGSEQNDCYNACVQFNPALHQYQAELFKLPYAFAAGRPVINDVSAEEAAMGSEVKVTYDGTVSGAVLMTPGAVTHQLNMNQRGIKLAVANNENGEITLTMPPPGGYVAQPGWYMLFLLNGDLPCTKASWILLTA